MKRIMTKVLALVMVFTMLPTIVLGESFSDMPNDWSSEALSKAVENGLLTGYNGKLMPEANLTRAQMAAIINRAFGSYASGSLESYTDVPEGKWYRADMAKAVQMKTFLGSGNMLNPESNITREEAFMVMARAMKLEPSGTMPAGFSDLDEISIWAKGEVFALINAGYVKGSNGLINPKGSITRAEFAQLMHNMIKNYVKAAGEYTESFSGNVMVNVPGVVFKSMSIKGDLIAGEGIGDGSLILDNVNIEGRLVVRGGGINSIIIKNSSSIGDAVIVSRYDGAVRVLLEDGTEVETKYIEDGNDKVIIEGKLGILVINSNVPVEIVGAEVDEIRINAAGSQVHVDKNSKVKGILVYKEAENTKLDIDGGVTSVVTAAESTKVIGDGKVDIIEVMSTGSKSVIMVETDKIVVDTNAKDVTLPEEPVLGGGGGGGGGGAPYVSPILTGASLNGIAAVISNDSINVPFSFSDANSYTISAQFNKAVKIKSVNVANWNLIEPNVDVPTAYSNPVTTSINHSITLDHFVTFGNDVTVVVTDGTTDLAFNITLNVPGYIE